MQFGLSLGCPIPAHSLSFPVAGYQVPDAAAGPAGALAVADRADALVADILAVADVVEAFMCAQSHQEPRAHTSHHMGAMS